MRTVIVTIVLLCLCLSYKIPGQALAEQAQSKGVQASHADDETPHNRSSDCDDTIITVTAWDGDLLPLPAELTPTATHSVTDQRNRIHVAVSSSTTPAGSSKTNGGLYVLTSRTADRWNRIATVFTNTEGATTTSVYLASNDRRCSFTYLHLYLAFCVDVTRADGTQFTQLMYTRSVDGGNTFSRPFRLDIHGGKPCSPTVTVTATDKIRVMWTDLQSGEVYSRTSEDGDPNFTRQASPSVEGNE